MIATIVDGIFSLFSALISVLPNSFVGDALDEVGALNYIPYINYFIPFYVFADIMGIWVACCALYLVYSFTRSVANSAQATKSI